MRVIRPTCLRRSEAPASRRQVAAVLLPALLWGLAAQAEARQWKPEPQDQAVEYAQIIDRRSETETVVVMWLAPEILEKTTESRTIRSVLKIYAIIGIGHASASPAGKVEFTVPKGVLVETGEDQVRQPLDQETLPPTVSATISSLGELLAQGMGAMGQGMVWFVFDGKGLESCREGGFRVVYADEAYDYETPIPGCE
ncbi:MAG: hypothetical protein ACE5JZ_02560 [Kiloniellales bacterium]